MHFKAILQDILDNFWKVLPLMSMEKWLIQNFVKVQTAVFEK